MEIQNYAHMIDRVMPQSIVSVSWSKTMDVCAILYIDNQLEMCRVSEYLQRMFIITEEELIQNVLVESNTLLYTIGARIYIYDLASHQKIIQSVLNKTNDQLIQLLLLPVDIKEITEIGMLSPIIPLANTNLKNWQNMCYLRTSQSNIITIAQSFKSISFNFNGILPITELENVDIKHLKVVGEQLHCFNSQDLLIYDISPLQNPNTLRCIQQLSYLAELLNFLKTSILSINTQLIDIYKVFQLNIITPLQGANLQEPINSSILHFYQQGTCPMELVNFFQKELYNTKILQKMDEKISVSFNNIQEILQDSLLNVLARILMALNYFDSNEKISEFNIIRIEPFRQMIATIKMKIKIFTQFQLECHATKLHLRNFFVWLNQCAIKATNDQEVDCENVNSPLNKVELNLKQLYYFLKDEHLFLLKNLQCFYSDKIQAKSFFVEIKQKPKLELKETENVTKCLQNVFKGLYRERNSQNQNTQIECEEQFITVNQLIRQMQNLQEQLQIQMQIKLINKISLGLQLNELKFSDIDDQKHYKFITLSQGKAIECQFNGHTVQQIEVYLSNPQNIIKEIHYYEQEPVFLIKGQNDHIIRSKDQQTQNSYECSHMSCLRISQRGLLSAISDNKKLIILSL